MGNRGAFSFQDILLSAAALFHFHIRSREFIINLATGMIHASIPVSVLPISFFLVSLSVSFLSIPNDLTFRQHSMFSHTKGNAKQPSLIYAQLPSHVCSNSTLRVLTLLFT